MDTARFAFAIYILSSEALRFQICTPTPFYKSECKRQRVLHAQECTYEHWRCMVETGRQVQRVPVMNPFVSISCLGFIFNYPDLCFGPSVYELWESEEVLVCVSSLWSAPVKS